LLTRDEARRIAALCACRIGATDHVGMAVPTFASVHARSDRYTADGGEREPGGVERLK